MFEPSMLGRTIRSLVVAASGVVGMARAAGAQPQVPDAGGVPAPSVTTAQPAPTAVGATPAAAPVGTAAYPSALALPVAAHAAGTAPAPFVSPTAVVAKSAQPISVQPSSEASAAHATAPPALPAENAAAEATQDWSVGAGIGWTFASALSLDTSVNPANSVGYSPVGSLGLVTAPAPTAITFFERRLASGLFALIQPEVSYFRYQYPNQAHATYTSSFALGLGLRWIGNPNAPVEVGMAHSVYLGRAAAGTYYTGTLNTGGTTTTATAWATPTSTSIGTASAFVAERLLMSQLWLRVSATVLRITWSKSEAHYELEDGSTYGGESRHTFGIRFGFEPAISLRLTF